MRDEDEMSPNSGNGRSVSLPRAGEILPLPVSPTGELGYSGVRGAEGWDTGSLSSLPYC
jgi:hypothetical protein